MTRKKATQVSFGSYEGEISNILAPPPKENSEKSSEKNTYRTKWFHSTMQIPDGLEEEQLLIEDDDYTPPLTRKKTADMKGIDLSPTSPNPYFTTNTMKSTSFN